MQEQWKRGFAAAEMLWRHEYWLNQGKPLQPNPVATFEIRGCKSQSGNHGLCKGNPQRALSGNLCNQTCSCQAEAYVLMADFGRRITTARLGSAITCGAIITTAPKDSEGRDYAFCACHLADWMLTVPVLNPLPHITMEIVESPRIGFEPPHSVCPSPRVFIKPGILA